MDLSFEQHKQIERYVSDEMNQKELEDFLEEVSNNVIMQEYLQLELELKEIVVSYELVQETTLRKEFTLSHIKQPKDNNQKTAQFNLALFAACAASLLACVFAIWITAPTTTNPNASPGKPQVVNNSIDIKDTDKGSAIKEKYYPNTTTIPTPSPTDYASLFFSFYKKDLPEEKPLLLTEALNEYEQGEYRRLEQMDIGKLMLRDQEDSAKQKKLGETGYYYKGLAFMETGNMTKAIANLHLALLQNTGDMRMRAKANWYIALAHLKKQQPAQAIPLLQSLVKNKFAPHRSKAMSLLQALNTKR
jgi:hypothetical protein